MTNSRMVTPVEEEGKQAAREGMEMEEKRVRREEVVSMVEGGGLKGMGGGGDGGVMGGGRGGGGEGRRGEAAGSGRSVPRATGVGRSSRSADKYVEENFTKYCTIVETLS